jgi:hypothetical protein
VFFQDKHFDHKKGVAYIRSRVEEELLKVLTFQTPEREGIWKEVLQILLESDID